jgi:hypothetical protein
MTTKLTTSELYELKDAINTKGALKADIYFSDTQGMPGNPVATARDIHGTERVLVVWVDGWVANPSDYPEQELIAARIMGHLGGKSRSDRKANSSRENGKKGGRPRKTPANE